MAEDATQGRDSDGTLQAALAVESSQHSDGSAALRSSVGGDNGSAIESFESFQHSDGAGVIGRVSPLRSSLPPQRLHAGSCALVTLESFQRRVHGGDNGSDSACSGVCMEAHDGASVCITEVSRAALPLLPGGYTLGEKGLECLLIEVSRAGAAFVR